MRLRVVLFLMLAMLLPRSNFAGPFTDEMTKCLVKTTTEADKTLLISWVEAAVSAHPRLETLSNISSDQGAALNKDVTALLTNPLTQRCLAETQQTIRNEGDDAVEASFDFLGETAMQELMADSNVSSFMSGLESNLDEEVLEKAFGTR